MENKISIRRFAWFLFPIAISAVLILCEIYLNNQCAANNWDVSRWITVAIIVAAFVLAFLLSGGNNEDKR